MKAPQPEKILASDVYRDGGSYMLTYRSTRAELIEIALPVRKNLNGRRIGYQQPLIRRLNPASWEVESSAALSWEEALELAQLLAPLVDSQIGLGGPQRAGEILGLLRLRGGLKRNSGRAENLPHCINQSAEERL